MATIEFTMKNDFCLWPDFFYNPSAISPDGSRIVSGSEDKTIRVWSAHDGAPVSGPFRGHTDWVWSVAYSPDGSHIVSGSKDMTIQVRSAQAGTLVAGPFRGHTNTVYSVAYSPDGSRIISGSADNTVRVWNAHDGVLVVVPFSGHTNSVCSVAHSPDGSRIISGSADATIRILSTHESSPDAIPSQVRIDLVDLSVRSSPVTCVDASPLHPTTSQSPNPSTRHHVRMLNSSPVNWVVRHDRWVVDDRSQLLFWIPFELARFLPTSNDMAVIYPRDLLQIDHDDMLLGERWSLCYKSE